MSAHALPSRRHFLTASTVLAAGLASMALSGPAHAQAAAWPAKPIKIVVAFPPGGLTDAIARNYGEFLSGRLGVPVVIENRPGAGAIIGIDAVAKSPADG
jgi:tripartite-type tricarboxylate transporter receptor subunit TctC